MKKFLRFSLFILLVPALLFSSCKKETETPERTTDPEFQALTSYMAANSMDLGNVLDGWITEAVNIKDNLDNLYVIDIRSSGVYDEGHIPGAVNCALVDVLDTAALATDPIIVVCFTGQSAGHAVVALRLSGYSDAKVLKWGMSGWHSENDSWTGNVGTQVPHGNWVDAPGSIVANKEFPDPDLPDYSVTDAEFLAQQVEAMLQGGFKGTVSSEIITKPGLYFINNFWESKDVENWGNILGAYRVKPLTIAGEEFKYIDPSKTIATYCWTGQTSSMVTAYLSVLGYTTTSLKFGVNSIIYNILDEHKWSAATGCPEDLPKD
ncbi:MAG: rhodanese-like domain-containing protein [Bacteroidota bacterium]|nr:rhodanese-like domain-containing protein [Bacteroidota bacterium]